MKCGRAIHVDVMVRGIYSGKSDCLVLPRNWSFHGKLAKKRHVFGLEGSQQPRKDAACL